MFEKAHPNIKVKLQNVGQGTAALPQAAHVAEVGQGPAGRGAHGVPVHPELHAHRQPARPDAVPAGRLPGRATPSGSRSRSTSTARPTACRGTPARSGFIYRKDLLDKAGIETPIKTWDEFADGGEQVPQGQPGLVPGQHAGQPDGPVARRCSGRTGARPFSGDPDNLKVNLTDPKIKQVTEFWDRLYADGAISHDADFTDAWYQGFAQRQVRRLALGGVGADLPAGLHEELQGQVARAGAAAVEARARTSPATGAARPSRC